MMPTLLATNTGSVHWIDHFHALTSIRRRLFTGGFGDAEQIASRVSDAWFAAQPQPIAISWAAPPRVVGDLSVRDGTFRSPIAELPPASRVAHVRELSPRVRRPAPEQPMYVMLAASGDEGFATRTRLLRPMVESTGIGALLLESPFYGLRRPPGQQGTALRTFAELMLMSMGMMQEGLALLAWLAANGHTQLGITGFSMGATVAALVAARWPRPLAAAILCAGRSAVPVFTRDLLSRSVEFERLGRGEGGADGARQKIGEYVAMLDIDRHPVPRCPEAAVIVGARHDGYVVPDEVQRLHELWKGSELRWLLTGHAGALIQHSPTLRWAAVEAMARLRRAIAAPQPARRAPTATEGALRGFWSFIERRAGSQKGR
ncbi:alpha/beta hydrolase family protein [Sorangium sp. So ce321]|uniref:alpha/beta hydrolase family protein n=1 Tax=Sorangium sp. So ce321 TaxID=3133300 RepID=UPI003F6036D6